MQNWMIILIIVACIVAGVAAMFIIGALVSVHIVLGRREPCKIDREGALRCVPDKFGVVYAWFDALGECTSTEQITAYDGVKLSAKFIRQPSPTGRVAICCHGYGGDYRFLQAQAKMFYDRGCDVILPVMRGHNGSGGKVGMAWIDRFDLLRWIDKAVAVFGKDCRIALFGISMGGATVVSAAGMPSLPSQVKCVIEDCGFSSQSDIYKYQVRKVPLPSSVVLFPLYVGVKLVHGYSIYDADFTSLASTMTIPALFIHGEADSFVPPELCKKLFDACGSLDKTMLTVPGAGHVGSYGTDPEKYSAAFTEFIDKHIAGSEFVCDSGAEYIAARAASYEKREEEKPDEAPKAPDAPSDASENNAAPVGAGDSTHEE